MSKKIITEEMKLQDEWYKEAKDQTLETLPEFINKLINNYSHDYGTICHAITASAIGTAWAIDKSDEGGITGFQASAIMWEFIKHWMYQDNKLGLRLINYDDILFPQYKDRFKNTISSEHWERIRKEAKNELEKSEGKAHSDVIAHWQSIIDGKLPFDFMLKD